ncbi:MAG: serine hydrolase [Chloroflexi bacterium]|nr:serine hydrolase [Chloroflexota bacterium]
MNGGIAPDGTRIVSERNLTETWRPHIQEDEGRDQYAMGWGVYTQDGLQVISHEGSYDGFTSILVFVPDAHTGLVVLNNMDDPGNFLDVTSTEFVRLLSSQQ